MTKQKEDYIVKGSIVLFFTLYMLGYAWLIEPMKKTEKKTVKNALQLNRPPMAADLDLQDIFDLGLTRQSLYIEKLRILTKL